MFNYRLVATYDGWDNITFGEYDVGIEALDDMNQMEVYDVLQGITPRDKAESLRRATSLEIIVEYRDEENDVDDSDIFHARVWSLEEKEECSIERSVRFQRPYSGVI